MDWTGLERKPAKNTNFAKAFGAGVKEFAAMISKSEDEAREIYNLYDKEMPFVSQLSERCDALAQSRGFVRMIDGARSHFERWGLAARDEKWQPPMRLEAAKAAWPEKRLRRADTRKAMSRLIQGSAARQTKRAMRDCWREGIVPLVQMHDELCFSVAEEATGTRVAELMRDAVKLNLPVKVDVEYGKSWGDAKHAWGKSAALLPPP
jgi:DNA polymerase-1